MFLSRDNRAREFVAGANLPWVRYGADFGASNWFPDGGLSAQPSSRERLEETLAVLERDEIPLLRVFMLCDGRSGIRYDSDQVPIGLDDVFLRDVDTLLTAAGRRGLRVMPTLLDFHLCSPLQVVNGVQLGGRAHLIAERAPGAALFDRILGPIVQRYAGDETIAAWDVINEPEWCLRSLRRFWRREDRLDALQRFLREAVDCIRASATQPVTIGCAGTWHLDLVRPLGLDFYQVHWYERFGWSTLAQPVAELGLDRPVILGEFSGVPGRWGIADVLDTARRAGYQGACVWSMLSEDVHSAYPPEFAAWAQAARGAGSASKP
jgi:hypothetical protein